jgi:hypothetical protein
MSMIDFQVGSRPLIPFKDHGVSPLDLIGEIILVGQVIVMAVVDNIKMQIVRSETRNATNVTKRGILAVFAVPAGLLTTIRKTSCCHIRLY